MESIDSKNDALRLDTSGLDRNLDSKYNLVLNKDLVKIESKYLDSTDSNAIADSSIAANFVDSIIAAFRDIKFSVLNMQDTPYYSNAIIKS
ncbi:MAG: hypothetical protein K2P17_07035 [Helicobacteraceae bacterium]|nr:hypothetical protein [Helicobacteraceae bacterium]